MTDIRQSIPLRHAQAMVAVTVSLAVFSALYCRGQDLKAVAADTNHPANAANDSSNNKPSPTLQLRPRYKIQPGDVMELSFPLSPEFNQSLTVAPDGYISLRGVGDLPVTGKTLPEMRELLQKSYSDILHDPVVNVDLRDFQKPYFTVGGEVGRPGKYDLREDTTVLEALAIAGGTTMNSKVTQVLLFRRLPGGSMVEVRKLNMKKMVKKGDLSEDARLQAGDLIYVPKSPLATIQRFLPTSSMGLYATPVP